MIQSSNAPFARMHQRISPGTVKLTSKMIGGALAIAPIRLVRCARMTLDEALLALNDRLGHEVTAWVEVAHERPLLIASGHLENWHLDVTDEAPTAGASHFDLYGHYSLGDTRFDLSDAPVESVDERAQRPDVPAAGRRAARRDLEAAAARRPGRPRRAPARRPSAVDGGEERVDVGGEQRALVVAEALAAGSRSGRSEIDALWT